MPTQYWFWAIYIFTILFSGWGYYQPTAPWFIRFGTYLVLWVLVGILGYQVFGSAVK